VSSADRGPIVVDTNVFGAGLTPRTRALAERYDSLVVGRDRFISFQTVMELEYGAGRARWGHARLLQLASLIGSAEIVWAGSELTHECVQLRVTCERAGHPLAQRGHNADLWIAATALRLDVPLVADDGIFDGVPGLVVHRA
jgi:predicted nucleic acid-binding protein